MADIFTKAKRSEIMSRIASHNTGPERAVRSILHNMGYRFRLHQSGLPGKPDVVLPRYKTVIFVHGCFWHRHTECRFAYTPKSKTAFWMKKFESNVIHDCFVAEELKKLGWHVVTVWECELRHPEQLSNRLHVEMNACPKQPSAPSQG